jgi:hypothetical protein
MALQGNAFFTYNIFFGIYRNLQIETTKPLYKIKHASKIDKLIVSTPGGLNGFYLLGVSSYLKEHYNISDYIYSGASAGAWNSLYLAYKGNTTEFVNKLLDSNIHNVTSIIEIEDIMASLILKNYNSSDFDLNKISIGVSVLKWLLRFKLFIYNDFDDIADAVRCCVASSHIPFITGGLLYFYRQKCCFDGGFFSHPYLNATPTFIISPDMWNSTYTSSSFIENALQMNKLNVNLTELYVQGYNDTKNNRKILDEIFL